MHTNIYIATYPLADRRRIDETFDELFRLLNIRNPLSHSKYYDLVVLGGKSGLSAFDLEQETSKVMLGSGGDMAIRPIVHYQTELHGTTRDGKQVYVFGVQPFESDQLRERAFSELASIREWRVLRHVVPELAEAYFGLTFWGLYYPEVQRAKLAKTAAEEYLKRKDLQMVSSIQSIDGERIVALPEKES